MILACVLLLTFGLEGSWLWQKVATDLHVGTSLSSSTPTNFSTGNAQPLRLNPSWGKGFRVTGYARPPSTDLDLSLYYSLYRTRTSDSWDGIATPDPFNPTLDIGNILLPPLTPFTTPATIINHLDSFYEIKLQQYGIDFRYPIECTGSLVAKPYVGLKGVTLDQILYTYRNWVLIDTQQFVRKEQAFTRIGHWKSFGFNGGILTEYCLGKGVMAFGNFGLALLWGRQTLWGPVRKVWDSMTPCADTSLGLLYTPFKYTVVKLAWENRLFFNQNLFQENRAHIGLYGLTLSAMAVF